MMLFQKLGSVRKIFGQLFGPSAIGTIKWRAWMGEGLNTKSFYMVVDRKGSEFFCFLSIFAVLFSKGEPTFCVINASMEVF